jgi:hypothetical protein
LAICCSSAAVTSGWAFVVDGDRGALPRQFENDRLTDATVAAGDDRSEPSTP